ncbi:hypothetical protein TNCV_4023001 [Trichonephila clavipes]|nr:hypothetical protein TNCV_4023001 [Trichonephila clavipes]
MEQRNREKEQQHINKTKIILLKVCTIEGFRNYDQKSSGKPDSSAVWNSVRSERFLACHVSPGSYIYPSDEDCNSRNGRFVH